jgi:hypothetical protein
MIFSNTNWTYRNKTQPDPIIHFIWLIFKTLPFRNNIVVYNLTKDPGVFLCKVLFFLYGFEIHEGCHFKT